MLGQVRRVCFLVRKREKQYIDVNRKNFAVIAKTCIKVGLTSAWIFRVNICLTGNHNPKGFITRQCRICILCMNSNGRCTPNFRRISRSFPSRCFAVPKDHRRVSSRCIDNRISNYSISNVITNICVRTQISALRLDGALEISVAAFLSEKYLQPTSITFTLSGVSFVRLVESALFNEQTKIYLAVTE